MHVLNEETRPDALETTKHYLRSLETTVTGNQLVMPNPIPVKVIRLPQVEEKVGLSRASIWRLVAAGHIPKPIKISARASGWIESEIDEFIQRRAESRNLQS